MSDPPFELEEIREAITESIIHVSKDDSEIIEEAKKKTFDWWDEHRKLEHTRPSPSVIEVCRTQQWYEYTGAPKDQDTPVYWKIRQGIGIVSEVYWRSVLSNVDVNDMYFTSGVTYECGEGMLTHPDFVGIPYGPHITEQAFPVELKTSTGWGYKRLLDVRGGVWMHEKQHYAQMQLHLNNLKYPMNWGLYIATTPDPGFLQSIMRNRKDRDNAWEMEPFYLEWIPRNEEHIELLLARARMLKNSFKAKYPPHREHDGVAFTDKGARTFPCGYCPWLDTCNKNFEGVSAYE